MDWIWMNPLGFGKAWIAMIVSPWWWAAVGLAVCQVMYTRRLEKRQFGSYIEAPLPLIFRTLMVGVGTGVVLSVLLSLWRFSFSPQEIATLWLTTLVLTFAGIRFACISYSVGLLAISSMLIHIYPVTLPGPWNQLPVMVGKFHCTEWLWLVAGFHIVEWMLIRSDGARGNFPVLMKRSSKEAVNGFMLRKSWPLPFVVNTSLSGFLPLPLFLSFSRLTLTKPLEQQKRLSSTLHLLLGLSLCVLMAISLLWKNALWGAAVLTFLGHELVYQLGKWREKRRDPLFVSNERGLKVFAVLPNSPAMAMGVKTGDIIQRLNGVRIFTHSDLENAVRDAAFCKLEVLDEYLDRHMMQKVLYQDDPRHLGIVGAVPVGKRELQKEIS